MKGGNIDLEALKAIFADSREHIAVGKIKQLELADDRSELLVMVAVYPDQREIVARMSWQFVGPGSGIMAFPAVNDMVLVAFAEGDVEQAFVINRLTSVEDKIPLKATEGHLIFKSLTGKQIWITSDQKILLSVGDDEPTENLVLGQQLKNLLVDILTELMDLSQKVALHTHGGNLGFPTSPPNTAADFVTIASNFDNLKSSPVEDEAILSEVSFTD